MADSALFRGRKVSPDSVKKTVDVQGLVVKIDRPKGLVMRGVDRSGKPWSRTYKYDYGFLPKTEGGDGSGVDVFIGPDASSRTTFWARQINDDGDFDEYKVFLQFPSRSEAVKAYKEHIPSRLLQSMAAYPIDVVRALMGSMPMDKVAFNLGLLEGLFSEDVE
jgi:hypothetical protein